MRLVHISDLHLGFRQYQRQTPTGINQREADVAAAFARAVEQVIELQPDVVLFGGDIFHAVRPSNPAILHAFKQLARLRAALPDAAMVMIAGNHDTPRSSETTGILRLFRELGIEVVEREPQRIAFASLDLSVLAVPDAPGGPRVKLESDPAARYNVLLLHGEVEGMLPRHVGPLERASVEISREDLGLPHWTYVALGHFHVYREIAPNAWYSGSLEYTSANPWGEMNEERQAKIPGKGFIERDLDTGEQRFHHVPSVRRLLDLPPVDGRGRSAAELDAAIRAAVEHAPGGIDDQVVRVVVRDVPRHIARELDHRPLREYKRRALHFHLDVRRPEITRVHGHGAPGRRPSLTETVQEKLRTRTIPGDMSREALVSLGLQYLKEAEVLTLDATAAAGAAEDA